MKKLRTPRYLQYSRLSLRLSPSAQRALRSNAALTWTSRTNLSTICQKVTDLAQTVFAHAAPIVIQHKHRRAYSSESFLVHPEDLFALLCLTHRPEPDLVLALLGATKGIGDPTTRLDIGIRALQVAASGFHPTGQAPFWGSILQHGHTYLVGGDPCRFELEDGRNVLLNLSTGDRIPTGISDLLPLEPIDHPPPSVFDFERKA